MRSTKTFTSAAMSTVGIAFVLALGAGPAAFAAPAPKGDGVWKITKVVITGAGAQTIDHPQPNLLVVYKGYYSQVVDTNSAARSAPPAAKNPAKLTDAEKLARYEEWSHLTANAGTFEPKGDMTVVHRLAAKSVSVVGTSRTENVRVDGNTMTIAYKSEPGEPASETTLTYTRVK
jgi:hypothetical protein